VGEFRSIDKKKEMLEHKNDGKECPNIRRGIPLRETIPWCDIMLFDLIFLIRRFLLYSTWRLNAALISALTYSQLGRHFCTMNKLPYGSIIDVT
jgi:hypothetical protein